MIYRSENNKYRTFIRLRSVTDEVQTDDCCWSMLLWCFVTISTQSCSQNGWQLPKNVKKKNKPAKLTQRRKGTRICSSRLLKLFLERFATPENFRIRGRWWRSSKKWQNQNISVERDDPPKIPDQDGNQKFIENVEKNWLQKRTAG